jgi:hypothetical protein
MKTIQPLSAPGDYKQEIFISAPKDKDKDHFTPIIVDWSFLTAVFRMPIFIVKSLNSGGLFASSSSIHFMCLTIAVITSSGISDETATGIK